MPRAHLPSCVPRPPCMVELTMEHHLPMHFTPGIAAFVAVALERVDRIDGRLIPPFEFRVDEGEPRYMREARRVGPELYSNDYVAVVVPGARYRATTTVRDGAGRMAPPRTFEFIVPGLPCPGEEYGGGISVGPAGAPHPPRTASNGLGPAVVAMFFGGILGCLVCLWPRRERSGCLSSVG